MRNLSPDAREIIAGRHADPFCYLGRPPKPGCSGRKDKVHIEMDQLGCNVGNLSQLDVRPNSMAMFRPSI
jgi:hypothetical protein